MRISYLSFSILEHYSLTNDDSLLSKAGKFRVVQLQTCSILEFKLVGDYDKFKMKHVLLKNNIILRSDTAFADRTNKHSNNCKIITTIFLFPSQSVARSCKNLSTALLPLQPATLLGEHGVAKTEKNG